MITIGYSTRKSKPEFINYLRKSSGYKKIHVIEKINDGSKSLSETYNEILNESKTDIVVLCHDDIYFDTSAWYNKLIKHFEKTDFGIIGLAGTPYLPSSGRWWESPRKMVGIVNHEHNGKKWESKYSESFENNVFQTIIVDGVFIALHKKRLKKNFNEEFKGFHFYDIPFCLENHIEGVKVGVITNIRITHKSIGQTNDQWESNRRFFEEKYKNILPLKLPFNTKRKLKVLLSCLSFQTLTGSELYVFELAKELIKINCDVTVLSQIGGPLTDMAIKLGIKCVSFQNPPGFKLGDGNWTFNDGNGYKPSIPNMLYKISEPDFDIIHIQHKPIAERIIHLYPDIEKIYTIHSEVISLEEPIKHDSIKKYIAIRPEIKDFLKSKFDIEDRDIVIIYNPVDKEKFKRIEKEGEYLLFVGTIDYLRKQTIYDLIDYTKSINKKFFLIGENKSNYLDNILKNNHVEYMKERWDVEKFVQNSFETAGIQLGRTTIESWMCGKASWIYKVDDNGNILNKERLEPPSDIMKFHSNLVAQEIKNLYLNSI